MIPIWDQRDKPLAEEAVRWGMKGLHSCKPFNTLPSSCQDMSPSAFFPVGQVAGPHLAGQDVADDARGHEAGNLRRIVGR